MRRRPGAPLLVVKGEACMRWREALGIYRLRELPGDDDRGVVARGYLRAPWGPFGLPLPVPVVVRPWGPGELGVWIG